MNYLDPSQEEEQKPEHKEQLSPRDRYSLKYIPPPFRDIQEGAKLVAIILPSNPYYDDLLNMLGLDKRKQDDKNEETENVNNE